MPEVTSLLGSRAAGADVVVSDRDVQCGIPIEDSNAFVT